MAGGRRGQGSEYRKNAEAADSAFRNIHIPPMKQFCPRDTVPKDEHPERSEVHVGDFVPAGYHAEQGCVGRHLRIESHPHNKTNIAMRWRMDLILVFLFIPSLKPWNEH